MYFNYLEVVERLLLYRNKLKLSQTEMGTLLGVNQSHYSKLEAGIKIISYDSLYSFMNKGGDVQYLLTGKRTEESDLQKYVNACSNENMKAQIYRLILWLVNQGVMMENKSSILPTQTYVNLFLADRDYFKISRWKSIREFEDLSQVEMAQLLDINIKRYRRIEKGYTKPDAEILSKLYKELGYSPLIFLKNDIFYVDGLNEVWRDLSWNTKNKLLYILINAVQLILTDGGIDSE